MQRNPKLDSNTAGKPKNQACQFKGSSSCARHQFHVRKGTISNTVHKNACGHHCNEKGRTRTKERDNSWTGAHSVALTRKYHTRYDLVDVPVIKGAEIVAEILLLAIQKNAPHVVAHGVEKVTEGFDRRRSRAFITNVQIMQAHDRFDDVALRFDVPLHVRLAKLGQANGKHHPCILHVHMLTEIKVVGWHAPPLLISFSVDSPSGVQNTVVRGTRQTGKHQHTWLTHSGLPQNRRRRIDEVCERCHFL